MLENKYSELIDDYSRHEYSVGNVVHDKERLQQLQNLSLDRKIMLTQARIIEWYNHFNGKVYVSFSGGKDSAVLAHMVHKLFPEVPLVFSNTGLEYIEIQSFAKQNNAIFVRPKMSFVDVIKNYGYPVVSKEVSEAIYYARKNNALCVAERERERERDSMQAARTSWLTSKRKQKELLGKRFYHRESETEECG